MRKRHAKGEQMFFRDIYVAWSKWIDNAAGLRAEEARVNPAGATTNNATAVPHHGTNANRLEKRSDDRKRKRGRAPMSLIDQTECFPF